MGGACTPLVMETSGVQIPGLAYMSGEKSGGSSCTVPVKVKGGYVEVTVRLDSGAAEQLPDEFPKATAASIAEDVNDLVVRMGWA